MAQRHLPTSHPAVQPSEATRDGPPRWRTGLAILLAVTAALIIGGVAGIVAGVVVAVAAWRFVGKMESPAARKRRERLAVGLPHVVDLMAACMSVGASPSSAIERVSRAVEAPMCQELAAISARLRFGVDPARVWSELGSHPQLGPLGRCVARATESGASVADAMHRLAADQRRASRAEVESRARAVGVKAAVPLGVCLLPAFILVGVVPLVAGSVGAFLTQ
jgi:Flp pilus assembly protein TadB